MKMPPEGNLDNWNPGSGSTQMLSNNSLLSTEAKDNPDTFNATNTLERFNGKATKPSGPLGAQGQEF